MVRAAVSNVVGDLGCRLDCGTVLSGCQGGANRRPLLVEPVPCWPSLYSHGFQSSSIYGLAQSVSASSTCSCVTSGGSLVLVLQFTILSLTLHRTVRA